MQEASFKSLLFQQFARIGHALGSGLRLEILELLAQSERSVDALAKALAQSKANVSQHLRQLRQAGLIESRKDGQFVFYRLADDRVVALIMALQAVGEDRLAEVDRLVASFLTKKDSLEPIPARELIERAKKGIVTVIDVRPAVEFKAGHLPGAINVPIGELDRRLAELPQDREIVAYCRGPYCMLAFDAVAKLRQKGLAARRLEDGFPEWRLKGLPVERE